MIGYKSEPINGRELSSSDHSQAGLLTGVATRALIQPLDVLKIRFQLQEEPIGGRKSGKYRGVTQSISLILREEGATAFWKGHLPAQGLSGVYGLVQFACFERISRAIGSRLNRGKSDFIAGGIAGSVAITAAMPLDVIRTRLVAQAGMGGKAGAATQVYRGPLHAIVEIWRHEGAKGYFRGWIPNLAQVAPNTGLQFLFYNVIIAHIDRVMESRDSSHALVAGAIAGTLAKTILYPLDLLRHRLQMSGFKREAQFGKTSNYSGGLLRCVLAILKAEGTFGLFKGLVPSQLKAATSSGLSFLFYKLFCDMLREMKS